MTILRIAIIVLLILFQLNTSSSSAEEGDSPAKSEKLYQMGDPELDLLWIDEKNGQYLPLDTRFVDDKGQNISLAEIIDRPTLLLPIYFYCPSSCSLNLVNLSTALKRSQLNPGIDFKIIALSFNHNENEENARIAKRNYLRLLPKNFKEDHWLFLTGTEENIKRVTEAIGYRFKEQKDGMFIHPSALVAIAEDGLIIKYVYGSFASGDVDIAIQEATNKTPANSIKRFLGYCFNYDPYKSRSFFQNLKVIVLLGFGVFGLVFIFYVRKSGKKNRIS